MKDANCTINKTAREKFFFFRQSFPNLPYNATNIAVFHQKKMFFLPELRLLKNRFFSSFEELFHIFFISPIGSKFPWNVINIADLPKKLYFFAPECRVLVCKNQKKLSIFSSFKANLDQLSDIL